MSNKGARNLFVFGSLFFFVILVVLTVDTMKEIDKRSPEITADVDAGKMVWHKYDCIGCHTIFGNGSYFAPDMTKITVNKPKGYLKKFLMDPRGVNPGAVMPKLGISSDEADKLLVFLEWTSKVDTNGWPPKPILAAAVGSSGNAMTPGQRVYQALGCSNCHTLSGIGGTSGPDLSHEGSKRDKAWLVGHFKDPAAFVPNSAMPAVTAPDADLEQLADYLLTLK